MAKLIFLPVANEIESGNGTCKGTFKPDGTSSWDMEGEYQMAIATKSK